ncbi:MAG: Lrp/AsnC family transcriptional regulator [Candidatus Margulisiibacteriota bacterium]|jgi:DNA-binding Lrp family transcriptional regulator
MKKIEKEILEILKLNARTSNKDIAQMLNIEEKEVAITIAELEDNGSILKYTTIIDEKKTQAKEKVRALIELSIRPEKRTGFEKIAHRVAGFKEVIDHYLISGSYDFLLIVEGESIEEISTFVAEKLASIDNVRSTCTNFIMRRYKQNGHVFEEHQNNRLIVSP